MIPSKKSPCFFCFIPLFLSLLILVGCFEVTTTVKVKADGSGTIEETVLLGEGLATMLKLAELQKSGVDEKGQFGNPLSLFDEDSLTLRASKMGTGVRLIDAVPMRRGDREGYRAMYAFDNVETIRISQTPVPESPGLEDMSSSEPDQEILFSFIKGDIRTLLIRMPEAKLSPPGSPAGADTTAEAAANLETMHMLIKGLRFQIAVEVEGTITETNASHVEGTRVTLMEVDFDKLLADPEQFQKLKAANPKTPEETRRLLSTIPGMKVETNRVTRIVF
ncbi:MAG TPA: hypothetical protein VNN76_00090 [Bacteroidota bacterium]|nr:hypothetical protein [Bacteroidota bacterium]